MSVSDLEGRKDAKENFGFRLCFAEDDIMPRESTVIRFTKIS